MLWNDNHVNFETSEFQDTQIGAGPQLTGDHLFSSDTTWDQLEIDQAGNASLSEGTVAWLVYAAPDNHYFEP